MTTCSVSKCPEMDDDGRWSRRVRHHGVGSATSAPSIADEVVELMLDQLLRNGSLDGSGLPLGKNTAIRSSYEGRGRRSITLAMSLASHSDAPAKMASR
jgi:hypothetical protein